MRRNKLVHRGGYISNDFVQKLFTTERLTRQVQLSTSPQSPQELQDLVNFIEKRATKIFAILLLIDQDGLIAGLYGQRPVEDDRSLFNNADAAASKPYCTIERLQKIPPLCAVAEKVYKTQWVFPAVLSPNVHLDFDPKFFKFPFQTSSTRIGSGASGQVHRVVFEKGYLKGLDDRDIIVEVVYKRIRENDQRQDDMKRIMKEMTFLRRRQHGNISPLIASFTAGLEQPTKPEDMTKCLYLLSPRADMDMQVWLDREPDYIEETYSDLWDTQSFKNHIFDSMRGLISGLAYIHQQIGEHIGYHGDIKPKNILKFHSEGKLAWKICDFGTSNLKTIDDTATRNWETTLYWAPEEFSVDTSEDENHGRSHDVWSLGCIFLLLATVLEYRWSPKGLKEFEGLRANGSTNMLDHAFSKCRPQITTWIAQLKDKCKESKELQELLDLIAAMLEPRETRIFSWEVAVDLYTITDPMRTKEETLDHLGRVIQKARSADLELKHKPMARAREDSRKDGRYRRILLEHGWYDDKTTEREKRACAAERFVSTLPTPGTGDRIFGMDGVLEDIRQRFEKTDFLALVGLRGVGKSLVALHHADRASKQYQQKSPPEKNVFWVSAHNIEDFHDSYAAIAAKFDADNAGLRPQEKLWESVKRRLERKSTKKWLMVVDGLDHDWETRVIGPFLPRTNGQILFTTRNYLLVKDLVVWEQRRAYIEMQSPDSSTAMKLFRTYVDNTLFENSSKNATRLLEEFNWPEMIRRISRYMNDRQLTCSDMYDILKKRKYEEMERLLPSFAEHLLIPTIGTSLREENERSDELRLLLLLCLFDNEVGLDLKLIQVEYDQKDYRRVEDWLEKLLACCFIRKQNKDPKHSVYLVDKTVHLAVRTWMEINETPTRKLERYNKILSMLYRSYDSRKRKEQKKRKRKASREQKPFASFKDILIPHFNSFVEYVKTVPEQIDFPLYDRAVQAVLMFSDVLLHEGHVETAVVVLEFTKRHFKLDGLQRSHEDEKEEDIRSTDKKQLEIDEKKLRRRRSVYFQLGKLLAKAYRLRAKDEKSRELHYFKEAEKLIDCLQRKIASGDDTVVWAGREIRAWELELEMIRVFGESKQFDKAWTRFKSVSNIGVKVKNHEAVLPQPIGASHSSKDEQELRRLAIRAKREECLLNFAHGQKHDFNDKKRMARRSWKAAHDACICSKIAVQQWFSTDDTLNFEIEEDEAKILVRLGSKENLDTAEMIFERVLRSCSEGGEYACEHKAWDIQSRLAEIRLKRRNPGDLESARESLEELVKVTRASLGVQNVLTDRCAELLIEALRAKRKTKKAVELEKDTKEAFELEKEFGKSPRFEKHSQWTRWLQEGTREFWYHILGFGVLVMIAWMLGV